MPVIALVGRPNVGKSTIFNRLINAKISIVDKTAGVTRDRIYGKTNWLDVFFDVIDTGGITVKDAPFQKEINTQVQIAIEEADLIVFVVSAKEGITSDDWYLCKLLKKAKAKVVVCINKSDVKNSEENSEAFKNFGFGLGFKVSAEHGIGLGDLLDYVVKQFPKAPPIIGDLGLKIAIIGKPNTGKSTLVNALINKERMIVSDVAGTTRDAVDVTFKREGKNYTIIDTAGIKRKSKLYDDIEQYALMRTQKAISRSDVIILLFDLSKPIDEQDQNIAGLAFKANIPTVVICNKWDLVTDKSSVNAQKIKKGVASQLQFMSWAPIIFISALENNKVFKLFDEIEKIIAMAKKRIETSVLNEFITKLQIINPAPVHKGQRLKILYATQVESHIPTFVLFCNDSKFVHFSYSRFLENKIRQNFGFDNVPITLFFKPKTTKYID